MRRGPKYSVIEQVEIGEGTVVHDHVNLYKCKIGARTVTSQFAFMRMATVIASVFQQRVTIQFWMRLGIS